MKKDVFIQRCLEAGMTVRSIGSSLSYSGAGIKYYIEARGLDKVKCPKDESEGPCKRKTMVNLSVSERKALIGLLGLVPADVVADWLGLCFRAKRCSKKTEPVESGDQQWKVHTRTPSTWSRKNVDGGLEQSSTQVEFSPEK